MEIHVCDGYGRFCEDGRQVKLLFVTSHLSTTNGWGKVAVETISRFARDGHQVTVLTDDATEVDCGSAAIIRVAKLASKEGGRTRRLRVLRDLAQCLKLRRADYDMVFCLTEDLLPLAEKMAKGARKFACLAIGTYAIKSLRGSNRSLYLNAFGRCDLIVCISKYTQNQLNLAADNGFANRTKVVPLGCDQAMTEGEYNQSVDARRDLVIAVGQLKQRKAIIESVRAFHEFRKHFPQFEFHVIGDTRLTDYVSRVNALIQDLDLGDSVKLVGKVDAEELREYYRRSKLLLMPSINENDHFEGFGLVHLEANSWGTPSIGSTNCGHEQAVKDGVSGLLTPQGDIESISEAMLKVLATEQSWKQYSRQAYQFSRTMSWDNYYRVCLEWIHEAVDRQAI